MKKMTFPKKKYNVIYADPAWQFNNKNTGGSMKSGAANQYDVMSLEDMKALPVTDIAADDCALLMWWVGAMPQEAIDLIHAWGFKLVNMNALAWHKLTKNGLSFFGMGYYTRAGSEYAALAVKGEPGINELSIVDTECALLAVKGKPKVMSHSVRAVRKSPVGKHSEKPAAFRDDIVKLFGDVPRIELFSRHTVKGWDRWGNEILDEPVSFL
jgi:N6-adenosine-specific RNA methylase IME4